MKWWISKQGGDIYDPTWQTKAWVAEHNAKPGDLMYDHKRTERGGQILRGNPSIEDAIHGVRESERFGAGEEGGRANNARRWLPHVQPEQSRAPVASWPNMSIPKGFDVNALTAPPPLGGNTTNNGNTNTVTMNPTTTIKIDGTSDPATTGAMVERGLNRVNELSLRNAQTAIR